VVLNIGLACAAAALAPPEVGTTADRVGYEYVGRQPFAADCPHNIFCYRVLVPGLLEHVPLPPIARWRVFAVAANATTGVLVARLIEHRPAAPLLASVLFQTSYGATFAVFDPFTPDPAVFLAAALLTLAWLANRPLAGLVVALVGVFAKETVALVISAAALASAVRPVRRRWWLVAAGATWLMVLGFHGLMDRFGGWSEASSGSADLAGGAWLARWLADTTLSPAARAFYVFIPFGFAWAFALLGFRDAPERLRTLTLAAVVALAPLVYVQTVERALATAFFVVVPLAALFLARAPLAWGLAAAIANGLLTLRVGLSPALLPPAAYLLALAAFVGLATTVRILAGARSTSVVLTGSSRVASSR
jgi:hypothetical protein